MFRRGVFPIKTKVGFSRQVLLKASNIKFDKNPVQLDASYCKQTEVRKLKIAFRDLCRTRLKNGLC